MAISCLPFPLCLDGRKCWRLFSSQESRINKQKMANSITYNFYHDINSNMLWDFGTEENRQAHAIKERCGMNIIKPCQNLVLVSEISYTLSCIYLLYIQHTYIYIYIPRHPKECLLLGFMYLKTCIKHPFGGLSLMVSVYLF